MYNAENMKIKAYLKIFLFTALWIVFIFTAGVYADKFFSNSSMAFTGAGLIDGPKGIAATFLRWDAVHYFRLAYHGYLDIFPGLKAFFPMYPLILRWGSSLIESHVRDGLYTYIIIYSTVNTLSIFGAMLMIQKLFQKDYGSDISGLPPALFMLTLPCAFFYLSPYPEALTLFLSAGAFLAAINRWWLVAGLLAGAASACRLQGIFLAPALAVEYAHQKQWDWKKIRWDVLGLVFCPVGALAYFWYLGGPQVFLKAQQRWIVRQGGWNPIGAFTSYFQNGFLATRIDGQKIGIDEQISYHFSFFTLCMCVFLLVYGWKKLRVSYRVYLIICLAVPLLSSSMMALQRYNLVMFPMAFVAADFFKTRPTTQALVLTLFGILSCFFVTLFVNGYFVS